MCADLCVYAVVFFIKDKLIILLFVINIII